MNGNNDTRKTFEDAATLVREPLRSGSRVTGFALKLQSASEVLSSFVVGEALQGRSLIGTSESCDVRLRDPAVSRRHAAVERSGHLLRLCDLGSTNGTFVNGIRVGEAFLIGGEVLTVGTTDLRVEAGLATNDNDAQPDDHFGRIVGGSQALRRLFPLLDKLAKLDVRVLSAAMRAGCRRGLTV